jgi:ribonuclease P protein component
LRRFFFTKADRILKRSDFIQIARRGRKSQNQHFIAKYSLNALGRPRLGITVTRKVGNAAARNRIKRLTREYFRLNRDDLTGSWDINVIAKMGASALTSGQAVVALKDLFDRIEAN